MRVQPFFTTVLMSLKNQNTGKPGESERCQCITIKAPVLQRSITWTSVKENKVNNKIFLSLIYDLLAAWCINHCYKISGSIILCFFFIWQMALNTDLQRNINGFFFKVRTLIYQNTCSLSSAFYSLAESFFILPQATSLFSVILDPVVSPVIFVLANLEWTNWLWSIFYAETKK